MNLLKLKIYHSLCLFLKDWYTVNNRHLSDFNLNHRISKLDETLDDLEVELKLELGLESE